MEPTNLGGGRADVALKATGERMVIEIKREMDEASFDSLANHYAGQTTDYQNVSIRLGFLLVLDLTAPKLESTLHIRSLVQCRSIQQSGETEPRYVVIVKVPGRRYLPSAVSKDAKLSDTAVKTARRQPKRVKVTPQTCRTSPENSERRQWVYAERLVSRHDLVLKTAAMVNNLPYKEYALLAWIKNWIWRDSMLDWYLEVNAVFRAIRQKAIDAQGLLADDDKAGAKLVNGYLKTDYQLLRKLWTDAGFPEQDMDNLGRHIGYGDTNDYNDILARDLPQVEARAETHARSGTGTQPNIGFEELLHPVIFAHAFQHYVNGHYRDAVLNSVVAIFYLMRKRTGLDLDGSTLATQVLSLEKPHLILSELDTESGRNDQKGFMQILIGTYLGIRNPKAHTLNHDLNAEKAAQYLIFASLLARRIYEATDAPNA